MESIRDWSRLTSRSFVPLSCTTSAARTFRAGLVGREAGNLHVSHLRFAPHAVQMKAFLSAAREPFVAHYRVNAGALPLNHWLHDPAVGGGRIVGEGCHFVDFLNFLADSAPVSVVASGALVIAPPPAAGALVLLAVP